MKFYKVRITDAALDDMNEIYRYIAYELLSPENAIGQYNRIADAILTLDQIPERYRIMQTAPEHSRKVRRMLIDNYSVFYIINDDCVDVMNVLYTPSNIEEKFGF